MDHEQDSVSAVSREELAAAVSFFGDGESYAHLNKVLRDSRKAVGIGGVVVRGGGYVIPITYENGGAINFPVPSAVINNPRFKAHFEPLARPGEITDLKGDSAKEAVEGVLELRKEYGNPVELRKYFEFNEGDGLIHGSEIRNLILLNKYLEVRGARTLTYQEGMAEERRGNLSPSHDREFGIVVHSLDGQHKKLAKTIIQDARRHGLKTPLLIHPLALDMEDNGVDIYLADNFDPNLVVSGDHAKEDLRRFIGVCPVGVRRIISGYGFSSVGGWYAGDSPYLDEQDKGLFRSYGNTLVDKIVGLDRKMD